MSCRIIDGTAIAAGIRGELAPGVEAFRARAGRPPSLGIVLVGHDPGSEVYVRNKLRTGVELGMRTDLVRLDESTSLDDVLGAVDTLNRSDEHDGILVQLPLPAGMGPGAAQRVFEAIDPAKDVDGFHPVNVGRPVQNRAPIVPCTPGGMIEILDRCDIPIAGRRAVVIGRSDVVGKPMALLLLHRHATVTICHSRTSDLAAIAASADILVAALGRPAFVTPAFVKTGAAVLDVGINRVTDDATVVRLFGADSPRREEVARRGSTLVGDVDPAVARVAGALTPVPGGVGPLTIAMLLRNTLRAAELRLAGPA